MKTLRVLARLKLDGKALGAITKMKINLNDQVERYVL